MRPQQIQPCLEPLVTSLKNLIVQARKVIFTDEDVAEENADEELAIADPDGDENRKIFREGLARISLLLSRMEGVCDDQGQDIIWLEADKDVALVQSSVLDIGKLLKEDLFDSIPTAIVTSATLATGEGRSSMQYMEQQLGLSRHRAYIEPSPFDLSRQLNIVIPSNMPDPSRPEFADAMVSAMEEIIIQAHGRTLALFTSFKMMNYVYNGINTNGRVTYPIYKQGEAATPRLIDQFRRNINSVLFGVASLWTGIDVPGEALSCLVIDKFPFTPPTDPIMSTYEEQLGRECFPKIQIPSAVMRFRQGAGRLIRTDTDKGVLVIMDNRVLTKSYGRHFLASFKGAPIHRDIKHIGKFLNDDGKIREHDSDQTNRQGVVG